jgi:hypothetical protein
MGHSVPYQENVHAGFGTAHQALVFGG